MHYVEAGDGEPVILLHGFPESWYSWRHQIEALAPNYHVIVPDQRGYNETENRPPYDTETLQRDILALMDHLGLKSAHVVGHDWGAAIAWLLAIYHPSKVRTLTICNVPHPVLFERGVRRPRQMVRSWYMAAFQLPWLPERVLAMRNYHILARTLIHDCRPETFTREDIKAILAGWRRQGLNGGLNWYRALVRNRRPLPEPVPPVQAPTLLVWGEKDIALGKDLTYGTEEFVPNLKVEYLPEASHWVQQDEPWTVNRQILSHLAANADGRE